MSTARVRTREAAPSHRDAAASLDAKTLNRAQFIAPALIAWHARQGRHDLPWQQLRSAYRIWISEIMLQQTQVATVIPYFERFIARFPDIEALAAAPLDDVLAHWSGLGYYARARNLHKAAGLIVQQHGGEFPQDFEAVAELPGIGRSTAGAILALSSGARHAILDGNVRRVLARVFAIEGDPTAPAVNRLLWQLAERCTPEQQVATYTQAIMDLGATVCTPRRPACIVCPLESVCVARARGRQHELPTPKKRLARDARPRRRSWMLVVLDREGAVFLERRPEQGIWGGLWCLPEFETATAARSYALNHFEQAQVQPESGSGALAPLQHAFTHFDLEICPVLVECDGARFAAVMEPDRTLWYNSDDPQARIGMPAPIRTLLLALARRLR